MAPRAVARQPSFVRPVFWEEPMPAIPDRNLPPNELLQLHFQRVHPVGGGASAAERPCPSSAWSTSCPEPQADGSHQAAQIRQARHRRTGPGDPARGRSACSRRTRSGDLAPTGKLERRYGIAAASRLGCCQTSHGSRFSVGAGTGYDVAAAGRPRWFGLGIGWRHGQAAAARASLICLRRGIGGHTRERSSRARRRVHVDSSGDASRSGEPDSRISPGSAGRRADGVVDGEDKI